MAASRGAVHPVPLLPLSILLVVLAAAPGVLQVEAADDAAAGTTHLHFFMHDIASGSNPTAVQVIKAPASSTPTAPSLGMSFGDTMVFDDALTETSSPTSPAVGRMQGTYMLSSQSGAVLSVVANILLTSGEHNGSTLAVMGRDDTAADVRELSVVGGTGTFRMATGYVLWKTAAMSGPDATVELDVYLGNNDTADTTPGGGGGDGSAAPGGASSGGSKSSSGATVTAAVSAAGWAVAAAAALVGSVWVW